MKPKFMQSRIEKDFEFFVKSLPALDPVEFLGMAKILSVKVAETEQGQEIIVDYDENGKPTGSNLTMRPMDEILEQMMDRYLELPKRRRREINQILKDLKREKREEVKKNGPVA